MAKNRFIGLAVVLSLFLSTGCPPAAEKIEFFAPVEINGVPQWLLIRGNDTSGPVLLYLHGGPGQSMIPYAHLATKKLIDHCIVVYWDQRGCGLSYSTSVPPETMTVDQFILDIRAVTEYLKTRFHKRKIFLLGHSWGTIIGMLAAQKYPADYYAYIGLGQVTNNDVQERLAVLWLKELIQKQGTVEEKKDLARMEAVNYARRDLLDRYGGSVHNISLEEQKKIMAASPYLPEKYTDELYEKGIIFAGRMWLEEAQYIDIGKEVRELDIPVYFFLGEYDFVTPIAPVLEYFETLKAPRKKIVRFEKSAHRMDIEEPEKFQAEVFRIIKETPQ